jgi:hypothetical protein
MSLFSPAGRHRARPRHAAGAAPALPPRAVRPPAARPSPPPEGDPFLVRPYYAAHERQVRRTLLIVPRWNWAADR